MAIGTPLLLDNPVKDSVDYKGRPVYRFNSGGWKSTLFIIGMFVEVAERSAYYGISGNLITYLTGPLGQSTVTAAENMNVWSGTSWLLPLLGAFVADSFVGRYRTIVVSTLIYILGLGLLALSAVIPPPGSSGCQISDGAGSCSPDPVLILFFFALYLAALGQGILLALNYIQDNINWGLGFGIPCLIMAGALATFLLGTRTYRYSIRREEEKHALLRVGRVFVATIRNWRITTAVASEEETHRAQPHQTSSEILGKNHYDLLKHSQFDAKVHQRLVYQSPKPWLISCSASKEPADAPLPPLDPNDSKGDSKVCSLREVEEAKAVLRLVPIWTTCLIYAIVIAQPATLFTRQALTMNRSVSEDLEFPAASVQLFISATVVVLVAIYDRAFVPVARAFTGEPSGITMLQRIGTGVFLSFLAMVVAALVEMKRLKKAQQYGLVDSPDLTIPMSAWWLIPQNFLLGAADVFTMIGMQEFFYDQVPSELRSVGLALFLSVLGVGNFLSSFLISVIDKATGGGGHYSWFANNLNRAHLDYFYWLLAALSAVQFVAFLYFGKSYIYSRGGAT
ncbi:hypothetical protein POTOM_045582 [Populus tomentosa]|uniref:Protein NRT1/ PTR FAMILY 5.10-like n=1 Tax=Populus tomentosa TaxID=118781 RepID=A0A8X7YJ88_POPTO|nr:hypothetical protein POTOM_045582 [Populus tomentosa]